MNTEATKRMTTAPPHKVRTLWLCGVLHGFTHVYHVALAPLFLLIKQDLGLGSIGKATLLVTIMMAAYFLPSYPMGMLADRFSRKKLLGYGLAMNGLGFFGLSFAPNYPTAVLCVLVAGLGGSFFHPAATAMVARLFPVNTGKALGLVGIGASVGFCLGPIYAGWRAEMAGWWIPVRELGLLGIFGAIVFYWLAEEEPVHQRTAAKVPHHVEKMFPTPALWLLFIAASFAFSLRDFAGSSMVTLGSLFLQKARHLDPTATGLTLSGMFLLSAVSNPLFGGLSDNARMRWVTAVLVISAGIIALFPHVPRGWLMPMVLVYGFFFLSNYPMVEAAVMQAVPDSVRGRVFGLFITAGGLVGNLSHGLVGRWVNKMGEDASSPAAYYGLYAGLAGLVMLSLLGLPCLHAIQKREQLEAAPPVEVLDPGGIL